MIAASAAWSTSVTKSFGALVLTCSRSRSSEARLMIAPAARAALMAMLSMGCSAWDMGRAAVGEERLRATEARGRGGTRCKMSDHRILAAAMPADPTRFVLVGTSHAGNVGAAARAMKVMGFADLVLVAPRFADVLQRAEAHRDGQRRDRRAGRRARRRHAGRGARRHHLRLRHRDDAARLRPADLRAARALRRRSRRARSGSPSCSAPSASAWATTTSIAATPA